jgi:ribonuclease P protein component
VGKDNAEPGVGARPSLRTSRPNEPVARKYPKSVRLRKRREFLAVQGTGKRFHGQHFLAVIKRSSPANGETTREFTRGRVGITVTKKIGNAVTRNRIKRLVREQVRQSSWLERPMDTVFIAKRSAAELTSLDEVAADLSELADAIDAASRRHASSAARRRPG